MLERGDLLIHYSCFSIYQSHNIPSREKYEEEITIIFVKSLEIYGISRSKGSGRFTGGGTEDHQGISFLL